MAAAIQGARSEVQTPRLRVARVCAGVASLCVVLASVASLELGCALGLQAAVTSTASAPQPHHRPQAAVRWLERTLDASVPITLAPDQLDQDGRHHGSIDASQAPPRGLAGVDQELLREALLSTRPPPHFETVGDADEGARSRASARSCAVVGNGGVLRGRGYGPDIDDHDYVLRFNYGPVSEHSADVGQRTSVRLFFPETAWLLGDRVGGATRGVDLQGLWVLVGHKAADFAWLRHMAAGAAVELAHWKGIGWVNSTLVLPIDPRQQVAVLSPQFVDYVSRDWLGDVSSPSSGMLGLVAALHLCGGPVDLYGFNVQDPAAPYYYFGQADTPVSLVVDNTHRSGSHSFRLEQQLRWMLADIGALRDHTAEEATTRGTGGRPAPSLSSPASGAAAAHVGIDPALLQSISAQAPPARALARAVEVSAATGARADGLARLLAVVEHMRSGDVVDVADIRPATMYCGYGCGVSFSARLAVGGSRSGDNGHGDGHFRDSDTGPTGAPVRMNVRLKMVECADATHYDSESHLREVALSALVTLLGVNFVPLTVGRALQVRGDSNPLATALARSGTGCSVEGAAAEVDSDRGDAAGGGGVVRMSMTLLVAEPFAPSDTFAVPAASVEALWQRCLGRHPNCADYVTVLFVAGCSKSAHNHFALQASGRLVLLDNDRCLMPLAALQSVDAPAEHRLRYAMFRDMVLGSCYAPPGDLLRRLARLASLKPRRVPGQRAGDAEAGGDGSDGLDTFRALLWGQLAGDDLRAQVVGFQPQVAGETLARVVEIVRHLQHDCGLVFDVATVTDSRSPF